MLYLSFKQINPDTRIGVSNIKDEIEKSTLGRHVIKKIFFIVDMSSNNTIVIYKVETKQNYAFHIFRDILLEPKSTFNNLIKRKKDYCDTVS